MNLSKCPLCDSLEIISLFKTTDTSSGEVFDINKCKNCSIVFTNPMPSGEGLEKYYKEEYYGDNNKKFSYLLELLIKRFRKFRADFVKSLSPSGRVLDIGCGRGWMLHLLAADGYEVIGTELTKESGAFAKGRLGLDIRFGEFEEIKLDSGLVDVVTMWHSFEHMSEPTKVLNKVHNIVGDDGRLFIAVPNFNSLQSRISKGKWFHLDAPRHLFHYTPESLERLLLNCGFTVEKITFASLEYNLFGMVQSLYNVACVKTNLLYDLIRSCSAKLLGVGSTQIFIGIIVMLILAPLVIPLAVILTVLTDFTPYGGTVNVVARKR